MRTAFFTLMLLVGCLLMGSCQKEVMVYDELYHTWEAKTFISLESVAYSKKENTPILLTFKRDGTYHLKLDINNGGGTFKSGKDQHIELGFPACTEACCDSEFSNKLASMLPKVTSYRIEGPYLYLMVPQWGDVKLDLVE